MDLVVFLMKRDHVIVDLGLPVHLKLPENQADERAEPTYSLSAESLRSCFQLPLSGMRCCSPFISGDLL